MRRGITLASERAPVVMVNTAFNKRARIFSLFHELAHVMTRTTSACGGSTQSASDGLERWCEQFAVAVLMPLDSVREFLRTKGWTERADALGVASSVAKRYKVSLPAAALRLIFAGHATWKLWNQLPQGRGRQDPRRPRSRRAADDPVARLQELGESATR